MRHEHRASATGNNPVASNPETAASNPEQLVELVARGEMPFPTDLSTTETYRLVARVRQRRQERLLAFIAELIARDIIHTRSNQKDLNDVP